MELTVKNTQLISKAVKYYIASLRKTQMENAAAAIMPGGQYDSTVGGILEIELENYSKLSKELDIYLQYKEYPLSD